MASNPDTRITSTSTQDYDIVVGLTEECINSNFLQLYNAVPALHGLKMKNINGSIAATLKPPKIEVDVTSGGNFVIFYIIFDTGTLNLNSLDDGTPVGTWPLDGCQIAFEVRVGLQGLNANDPAYQRVELSPEDYSLTKLYLDVTDADLSNPVTAGTIMPDLGGADASYTSFLFAWMTQVHHSGSNIVGVQASQLPNQNPFSVPPSFPPTSLHLQPYYYLASGQTQPQTGVAQNCLCYLQTTANRPDPFTIYTHNGNLNNPGQNGTMIMSQNIIWNQWLLPQLQALNYQTWLTDAYCYNSGVEGSENWNWGYKMGPDALVQWNDPTATDATYHGYQWNKITDGSGFGYNWNQYNDHYDYNGTSGSQVNNYVKLWTTNYITVTPGNQISVGGSSQCTITVGGSSVCWAMCETGARGTAHSNFTLRWEFQLVMTSIDHGDPTIPGNKGGINITVNTTITPGTTTSTDGGLMSAPTGIRDALSRGAQAVQDAINGLETTLAKALAYQNKFVVPGNGTFDMLNPAFNNNLDLLIELQYAPAPQPAQRLKGPKAAAMNPVLSQQDILEGVSAKRSVRLASKL